MKKKLILLYFLYSISQISNAQIKILFDATKAETAGNADWIIDADQHNLIYSSTTGLPYTTSATGKQSNAQQIPSQAQSTITTSTVETFWEGGLSNWGIDCVKKGYQVETLPYNGSITYGDVNNLQDLSKYKIFVVVEPNIVFSASEKTAIINFVKYGGSLFIVSDHTVSDRNNDGWDSPAIWNDLFTNNTVQTNPFGMSFDLVNISGSSTNITSNTNDSLIHGSYGNVSQVLWSNGATITINTTANSTVKASVYKSGASNTGSTNIMVAYARYGLGKVVAFGDSSPFDDGTGDANDVLYNGYTADASGNHQKLIMNATVWLATQNPLPVTLSSFTALPKNNNVQLNWATKTETNTSYFNVQQSTNGKEFATIGIVGAKGFAANYLFTDNNLPTSINKLTIYYRLEIVDKDGNKTYSEIKSIENKQIAASISFYPNPAKNYIVFNTSEIAKVEIFTTLEKLLISKQNLSNNKLDISALPIGFYYIRITTKEGLQKNEKLIID